MSALCLGRNESKEINAGLCVAMEYIRGKRLCVLNSGGLWFPRIEKRRTFPVLAGFVSVGVSFFEMGGVTGGLNTHPVGLGWRIVACGSLLVLEHMLVTVERGRKCLPDTRAPMWKSKCQNDVP